MAKTHPVKWYSDEMQGAPQHTKNTEGLLIQHLKALLVTGFGSLTPDSIVWDASEGAAKATFGSGHSYLKDSVIECSGATPTDYNGEHLVTKVDTNNVWFELDAEPAGDATGTLEIKYPSLGWSISHESGDGLIAIFVAAGNLGDVSLRVDNTPYQGSYSKLAKVDMVTDVVDINTFEYCKENYSYSYWFSSCISYDRDKHWTMVGDSRIFYWFTKAGYVDRKNMLSAGYMDSRKVGDRYHFLVEGGTHSSGEYTNHALNRAYDQNYSRLIARGYTQLEGAVSYRTLVIMPDIDDSASQGVITPNPVDNSFLIQESPILVAEASDYDGSFNKFSLRGELPIIREVLTNVEAYDGKVITKDGKKYLMVMGSCQAQNSSDLRYSRLTAFDITPVEV